jgi:hypothetical protein
MGLHAENSRYVNIHAVGTSFVHHRIFKCFCVATNDIAARAAAMALEKQWRHESLVQLEGRTGPGTLKLECIVTCSASGLCSCEAISIWHIGITTFLGIYSITFLIF